MKRILITGKDSYIGTSFEKWVRQWPEEYQVRTVDTINNAWKAMNFNSFDVVLHVAAIVHKKEKKEMADLYEKINCDLPFDIAKKAKSEGVKQFIFMSTMSVYGLDSGIIDKDTPLRPKTLYGQNKLKAEKVLIKTGNNSFQVSIIRPPMVYGKSCKGNYTRLSRVALKTPVFPKIKNQRSMIHIDNLCAFIRLLIDEQEQGIFFPQNEAYVNSTELVANIAKVHHKKIHLIRVFNPLINLLIQHTVVFKKVFGSLVYDQSLSHYKKDYNVVSFRESIELTEK